MAPQIADWFREYKFAYRPNMLTADFDGDGKKDYAMRIHSAGKDITLALLDRGSRYESHVLSTDTPDPFTFLLLYEKGARQKKSWVDSGSGSLPSE